ncbi:hypothetical protein HF086_000368 [Spodoptera exigua]|uniref:Uncharacterized protein n=1 Tax=Spodoptera exigua TaxID=7107 RepID=A0A922MAH2_SPOEX|nr:hypothetical protein HF086_000368 [Spodoptera exigua]
MTQLLNDGYNDSDEDDTDTEPLEILLNNNVYDVDNIGKVPEIPYSVTSIRCAAHTLQLAVNDALQEDESIHTIKKLAVLCANFELLRCETCLKHQTKKSRSWTWRHDGIQHWTC